jgi:hypothetical protein
VLGKFAGSKLAIVTATVASVGVISGALALPGDSSKEAAVATAIDPVATVAPAPAQVIRRVMVVRRSVGAPPSVEVENVTIDAPAPKQPGQSVQPAQPAGATTAPVAAAPRPTATPAAKSRGS